VLHSFSPCIPFAPLTCKCINEVFITCNWFELCWNHFSKLEFCFNCIALQIPLKPQTLNAIDILFYFWEHYGM
jgi:hypothetical protein